MNKDLNAAKRQLNDGGYTCVVVKGEQMYTSTERGVKPLLMWLDDKTDLNGYCAADKVVGNGAAMLYVLLGVAEVYAGVISSIAKQTLTTHGILVYYDQCVDAILNRTNTGFCPMETAVGDIKDPHMALQAIQKQLANMKQ